MRKIDSIAQERAGPDHILSLLPRLRLARESLNLILVIVVQECLGKRD